MGNIVDPLASVRGYLAAEKSDATRRAYNADFADFRTWCDAAGETPLPASPIATARYLAGLADAGLKASTIVRRCAAIRYFHRSGGHEPPTNAEGVKAVLRGIRRKIGAAPNRKAPATAEAIAAMIDELPETLAGIRDRALLLVGFAAALRRSELVAIAVPDIEISKDGVRLFIPRSKTDQEGKGYTVSIPAGTRLKPVAALERWLASAKIASGPVFREVDRHGNVGTEPLSTRSVARIIKRAAAAAGLDEKVFSGHSLRAGFVTQALENGSDIFRVMDVTRHSDPRQLKVYDRRARGFAQHPGKSFL